MKSYNTKNKLHIPAFTEYFKKRTEASFTIEAAVILPLTFLLIVWMINASLSIHGKVLSFNEGISGIISRAPLITDIPAGYEDVVDGSLLDGRAVLLKYKLLKDGVKILTGGLNDD